MTYIFGVVNVSPDSFSGDGLSHPIKRCELLLSEGADGVDLGAFSTRPGAPVISEEEELNRIRPVLRPLAALCRGARRLFSVDTCRASVAAAALEAGADVINDVTGGEADPSLLPLMAANPHARYIFMHSMGAPVDPARRLPDDCDPVDEILRWKRAALERCEQAGIKRSALIFDPGVGFGKNAEQSRALIRSVSRLRADGIPLMIGHSRKSFLQGPERPTRPEERDPETLAVSVLLAAAGVEYLRVHDVGKHARVLPVALDCLPA